MNHYGSNDKKTEAAYQKLTGVDINEQYKTWDARGKGYCGEYMIFSELYTRLPGRCKVLMNIEIPSMYGRTTEIDLLLIHETGLYVFEVKHYKGTIYGKMEDPQWTQYFRTEPNHPFYNPVLQNNWHIEQLQKLCPGLPIRSYIVFTRDDVTLKVTGDAAARLCCKHEAYHRLTSDCNNAPQCLTPEQIDGIFNMLKVYSPIREASVTCDDTDMNLYQFIEAIGALHSQKMQEMEISYIDKEKAAMQKAQQFKLRAIGVCAAIALILGGLCVSIIGSYEKKAQEAIARAEAAKADANAARTELQEFAEKWEYVTDFEIDGTVLKEDFVVVDYATLENSEDFSDVVYLSFSITHNGEDFYALIDKNSSFIILLNDGRVIEAPCYGTYYHYSLGYSQSAKTLKIKRFEFSGFSAEDVASIKIANIQIKRIQYIYGEKPALTDYEVVLYRADNNL